MIRRRLLAFLTAGFAVPAMAAPTPQEQARIDRLIRFIEAQKGMTFIRNDKEYSCAEAAEFLRGKMDAMGAEVTTARDFIERIGSKSSTTGKPYQVKFTDGRTMPAAQLLSDELKRIERQPT